MDRTSASASRGPRRGLTLIEVLVIVAMIAVVIALLLPAGRSSRGAARRAQCMNNLKNLALAVSNDTATHGVLPPASTRGDDGRPLHGWRTLILSDLDEESLGRTIDLTLPWDDPKNTHALAQRPSLFGCPNSTAPKDATAYLATLEPGGCLIPGKSRRLDEVTDGAANTLLMIEAGDDRAVPWTSPRDADGSVLSGLAAAKLHHPGGTHAAFADGAVRFLKATTPVPILRALTTAAGGEVVSTDSY